MTDEARWEVRMWGLTEAQRDALLALAREWDTFYEHFNVGRGDR